MAALKKPVKKKDNTKPGTVLIVFLVIFVLASISLGVLAWFGYREQDDLRKAAESARSSEKTMKINRDYRVALVYLLGSATGYEKLPDGDRTFAENELDEIFKEGGKYKSDDSVAFAKAVEEMKKDLGWDGKKFATSYSARLKQALDDLKKAEEKFAAADEKRKEWENKYNSYVNTIVEFDKARSAAIAKGNAAALAKA
ncbi:MAG: hypothetical protein NZO58_02730, partial [Gemmataceae bacterium]|nr:hypothetical protein [Gemmataceae bacterium]